MSLKRRAEVWWLFVLTVDFIVEPLMTSVPVLDQVTVLSSIILTELILTFDLLL